MIRAAVAIPERDMSGGVTQDVDLKDNQALFFGEFLAERRFEGFVGRAESSGDEFLESPLRGKCKACHLLRRRSPKGRDGG